MKETQSTHAEAWPGERNLTKAISQSRDNCRRMGLNEKTADFSTTDFALERKRREKNKRLFIYSNSVMEHMKNLLPTDGTLGYGVFSADGYLLRLYGGERFHRWCESHGIVYGTCWDEASIGTNAVGLGLRSRQFAQVIGKEHYAERLHDMACYFEPITNIISRDNHLQEQLHGGLAILCPAELANDILRSLIVAVAREVSLQYLWFDNLDLYMDTIEGFGYIFLDKSLGRNSILAVGNNTYHILKWNYGDYYYKELETIIPPIGKNSQFWDIINNRTECTDVSLSLWMNGNIRKVSISTVNYKDERFHMDGVLIAINSMHRIKQIISKYVGLSARLTFDDIVGANPNFLNAVRYAKEAARSTGNILLLGESGTGKDVFAQAIHNHSDRKDGPFVAINCAALSKELIYSELFGYEEGAYTGAKKGGNIGKFELANHGTIFLDEIGDMPLDLQATLLRVIEQRSFMRLGSNTMTNVDVRIIAATNVNLMDRIQKKLFREDLFYRLGIVRIHIPPLRERGDDVFRLMRYFADRNCKSKGRPPLKFSHELMELFRDYPWPGNVRELQNLLEGLVNIEHDDELDVDFVKQYLSMQGTEVAVPAKEEGRDLNRDIRSFAPHSRERVLKALEVCKNNRSSAAAYLGISRSTLYRKMKEYGMLD